MSFRWTAIALVLAGCGRPQQSPNVPTPPAARQVTAPIEYRLIEKDEKPHNLGPQVALLLETSNDVAQEATKDDLQSLWEYFEPTLGNRRVFIRLKTNVPGASPWGLISRYNNLDGKWTLTIDKNDFGVDAQPYYFVDKIDRSQPNQGAMILTLSIVNRIVERLKLRNWKVTTRTEEFVGIEEPASGLSSLRVVITPESITVNAYKRDEVAIFSTLELVAQDLGIYSEIKGKMQTVIGSPEYFGGVNGKAPRWDWIVGDYYVSYMHSQAGVDDVDIGYANEQVRKRNK